MSKKYDYNLQEIKEGKTIATNSTSVNLGMTCDSCGRVVSGITYVNGMKFCAKCYQETFGANKDWQLLDKDKTIEELKQQLAEKDKQIESLKNQLEKEACNNIDWEGKCLCLYSTLYETLEKLDPAPNDIASAIQQMTKENFDEQNEQFKTISVCKELMRQVEQKDDVIKQFKEKVEEEADFKEEYYHYWQDAKKEIEEYRNYFKSFGCKDFVEFQELIGLTKISANDKDRDDILRHEICEKITRFMRDNFVITTTNCSEEEQNQAIGYDDCLKDLKKLVDQIERGE